MDEEELRGDLESWLGALSRAGDGKVALLIRQQDGTNALEWEHIGGSAF